MAKKLIKSFDTRLHALFVDRTHWLKSLVRRKTPGAAPVFGRKKVNKAIESLQDISTDILLRSKLVAKPSELYDLKRQWHPKRNKGWGIDQKKARFNTWYEEKVDYQNCVYSFWDNRKCLYVGRTLKGKGRPSSHFEKAWFGRATRVDIWGVRDKRKVPMLECLATHRFEPSHSKNKPSTVKHASKCPICQVHGNIREELRQIFRLR
jgi:hypothetical protein